MRTRYRYLLLSLAAAAVCLAAVFPGAAATATTMPSAGKADPLVVDISQWNDEVTTNKDDINFALLATQVKAVYIRSFGHLKDAPYSTYIDYQAVNFAKSAHAVNLKYGFYYYYIPTTDEAHTRAQARMYFDFIKDFEYSCIPVLDVEENPYGLTPEQLASSVKAFTDEFRSVSGMEMMIYTFPYFIANNLSPASNWDRYMLWIANYNVPAPMSGISSSWMPSSKWCWQRWDMWQYTSSGTLSSIPSSKDGHLDLSTATDNIYLSTPGHITVIDSPNTSDIYGGDITLAGWALSYSGVSRVDIYADNNWIGSTGKMSARPDVQALMNSSGRYNDGLYSGFSYTMNAASFTVGQHSLQLAVINQNGTVNWASCTFNVGPQPQMALDSPSASSVNGDILVKGWALSHAGISRVNIYVDDIVKMASIIDFYERTDVNAIINQSGKYKNGLNSGFSYYIADGELSAGPHKIRVDAVSFDGTTQSISRTITVGSDPVTEAAVNITYQSHVQDVGWQTWMSNGAISGTSGESKRLEAICIKLNNLDGGIEYKTHVQDIGWMDWTADGTVSGTSGQSKRLEAIQIRLTGAAAEHYDVYYRVHAQNIGWMDWARNGEPSGTAGYSYRLEAIQIVLMPKGGAAPGATARPFAQA